MTFNASSVTLETGLKSIRDTALQEKAYLATWKTALAGNVDAFFVISLRTNIDRALAVMDAAAALPGMGTYAQAQLGGANYDIVAEYTTMRNALDAIRTWINASLPSGAVSVSNGVQVAQSFAPAVTAPLLALVNAAAATIA